MTYNPKTHLLRPLEPGEIIEADDLMVTPHGLAATSFAGEPFRRERFMPAFRPVPVQTGWRPRSEAHLIKEAHPDAAIIWRVETTYATFSRGYEPNPSWTHFYIIPPCDLPPPDPERERFEAFIKDSFNGLPDKEQYAGTKEAFWKVWQAAARKELV